MSNDFERAISDLLNQSPSTPEKFSQPSKMIQFPINQIKVGPRFRDDVGDLTPLIESIKERGLLHPILITPKGELIAGYRRYLAYKELGMESIDAKIVDVGDVKELEMDENLARKDFTLSEKAEIAEFLLNKEKELARQRMRLGGARKSELSDSEKGRALEKVARRLGLSRPTLQKAMEVVASGREDLIKEMDQTGRVDPIYRKLKNPKSTSSNLARFSQPELEFKIEAILEIMEEADNPDFIALKQEYSIYKSLERLNQKVIFRIIETAEKQGLALGEEQVNELREAQAKAVKHYFKKRVIKALELYVNNM